VRGDDRAIGTCASHEKRQGKVTEIGYALGRSHWGHGYAREAVSAVIDRLFDEGQRRVFADTDPQNSASIALLETLGFTREARLRAEWETHIGVRDSLIFGLLRHEWRRRHA
jgi:[ribosomal protein S5]-alanine N-acetyltransferase